MADINVTERDTEEVIEKKSFIAWVRSVYKELHADRETGC